MKCFVVMQRRMSNARVIVMRLFLFTHVELNESMSYATIYIYCVPESKEEASLFFMKRQLTGLRTYIKRHAPAGVLPF